MLSPHRRPPPTSDGSAPGVLPIHLRSRQGQRSALFQSDPSDQFEQTAGHRELGGGDHLRTIFVFVGCK